VLLNADIQLKATTNPPRLGLSLANLVSHHRTYVASVEQSKRNISIKNTD
jgi:hypothetical protein